MAKFKDATVLLVEDDAPQRRTLGGFLTKKGYQVIEADSAQRADEVAKERAVDLLVTDLRLGGPDGVDLLETLRERLPHLQAIVVTAYGTVDDAVRAMRAGAYDFVAKPVDLGRLELLVEKALEKADLSRENRDLREMMSSAGAFSGLVGESATIRKVKELGAKVAITRANVLILGESGTGKEVLARAIHLASPRRAKPFVTVNCAALPETLIEAELFGHEKGAFTGATAQKKGRFELACGGTLFLDEVGDIPPQVQVKLLNILQSGHFERVGGTETIRADTRVIAATNTDLQRQVAEGRFREDLYYRLNVVAITMPPLRDRPEDIPLLIDHFLGKHADLSGTRVTSVGADTVKLLQGYPFPGNVRELENWIERAVVLAEGEILLREDFPDQLTNPVQIHGPAPAPGSEGLEEQVAALEISLIRQALEKSLGNQSAAARELKITERSIRYKMKKYGL